jgi:hypothetical protein
MNLGRDFKKAVEQAKANAARTGKPRYLHVYGGVLWLSFDPPSCGHWLITPGGEVMDIDENMAGHLYRLDDAPGVRSK